MKLRIPLMVAAAVALVAAATTSAHVEAKPEKVKAGSLAKITFEVPAEEKVPAVKIAIQVPVGVGEISPEKQPGWTLTQEGRVVTWSGGKIAPGKTAEFVIHGRMPSTGGKTLLFPTLQTYSNGEVVHWISPDESADTPAPRVQLTAAATEPAPPPPSVTQAAPATDESDDGDGHLVLWLVLAAVALGLVAVGITFSRRRRA